MITFNNYSIYSFQKVLSDLYRNTQLFKILFCSLLFQYSLHASALNKHDEDCTIDTNCSLNPDKIWNGGGGDNNWFNPVNWDPVGVPTATDNVSIGDFQNFNVEISIGSAEANSITFNNASSLNVFSGAILNCNSVLIYNGSLKGLGSINGNVSTLSGGHLTPGDPNMNLLGPLFINGDFSQNSNDGVLDIQIHDIGSGDYSVLNVTGTANLAAILNIAYANYNPLDGDNFIFLSASSISGTFMTINAPGNGWTVSYNDPSTGQARLIYHTPPPSNEDCSTAQSIILPTWANGYTFNGNPLVDPMPSCNTNGHYDVWYSIIAPASGEIIIKNFPPQIHVVALWSGTCGSLTQVACYLKDNNSPVCDQILALNLNPGDIYFIQLITENPENFFSVYIEDASTGPVNDFCSGAIQVTVGATGDCPTTEVNGNTLNAHHTEDIFCINEYQCNVLDVWYKFTAPTSGLVKFHPGQGNPVAKIFSGTCNNLTEKACLAAEGTAVLTGNNDYFLLIATIGYNNYTGESFTFCLDEAPPPPPNNTCAGAILIPVSDNGSCINVTGSTIDATSSKENPCAFGGNEVNLPDLWYSFVAPADGRVTFHSGTGDPTASIYSGTCSNLNLVDNGCTKGSGTISGLTPGQTYYLQLMTPPGPGIDFDFCLEISSLKPSNNNCLDASPLTLGTLVSVPSTIYANSNPGLPVCAPLSLNTPSVWYSFTAYSDSVSYDNKNGFILALTLYSGCNGSNDQLPNACALPFNNYPTVGVIPGTKYYAQLTTVPAKISGYEFTLTATGNVFYPEIDVQGNGLSIDDGDITPGSSDDTYFGNQSYCIGTIAKTYTIKNDGGNTLNVYSISITGMDAADFSLSGIILPITINPNNNTTFTITFDPSTVGTRIASINIVNDDSNESNYDFAISGTGTGVYNPQDGMYYCNLQDALNASETMDGDELQIQSGIYSGPCIEVTKTISIKAIGGPVTLDCVEINGSGNMLELGSDFTFNMLMLMNGKIHLNGHNLSCGSISGGSSDSYIITD